MGEIDIDTVHVEDAGREVSELVRDIAQKLASDSFSSPVIAETSRHIVATALLNNGDAQDLREGLAILDMYENNFREDILDGQA